MTAEEHLRARPWSSDFMTLGHQEGQVTKMEGWSFDAYSIDFRHTTGASTISTRAAGDSGAWRKQPGIPIYEVSVVMPVYNERATLRAVVERVLAVPLEYRADVRG